MKGGIELSLIMSFTMMLLMANVSIVGVMITYNNARVAQEQIVAIIEYHNAYNQSVVNDISRVTKCNRCHYTIDASDLGRYRVSVTFPIRVMFASFESHGQVSGYTVPIHN